VTTACRKITVNADFRKMFEESAMTLLSTDLLPRRFRDGEKTE
jgi:hypothetical protein